MAMKSALIGIVLGLAFVLLVHSVPPQPARQLIALSLAFLACVYCGALLAQSVPGHVVALELTVALAVFACAAVGLRASTSVLAAGWVLHGIWDLLHVSETVPTRVDRWFPPLAAAFAFVVAVALLIGPWRPLA